jgi:GT2 family glycosyltransferase
VAQISARSMKLREDLAQQTAINEQLRHELSLLNAEYVQLNLQLSQRIESILHSSSWRLTSPIRALSERMRIVLRKIGGLFRGQSKSRRPQEEKNLIGNSGLFDRDWYLTQINDEASAQIDPLSHYVDRGASEGRNPNPLFDTAWYLTQYPDVAAAKHNPLLHYLSYGAAEGRDPHPLFDTDWYQMQNPDVVAAGVNPLAHYLSSGASEGRDPNQAFQTSWYLQQNPEIAATGVNPLVHYVLFGLGTSRAPNPLVPFSQVEAVRRRIEANPRYRPTPSELCGMPERALPKAIVHLLQTCHDTSAIPLIRSVYGILESYGGVEIGESDLPSYSDVEALAATISALANRDSQRETVDATIIIPVHNHIIHTLCCLQLVLSLPTRSTFEIVVADDASTDATAKLIASIGGAVRHHRNNINVGFTVNCNAAASMARGDVLVFLNNDTIPLPYWLDELIDSLRSDPSIGLVGSKLIDADGALQEAGGIVWNDGTAWNYGRGGNAIAPEFNYVKDADYISGACIAIQKNLWDKLSGFDEIYAPAYYEDVDLAFRVRAAGLRTVYQPFSGVVHHEGVSHGRDTTVGLKSYQVRNGQIFFEKWQSNLSSEHLPPGTDIQFARDRSKGRPRILFIDHGIPEPDRDAGSRALDDYIKLFVSKKFHVTFLPQNRRFDRQYTTRLQRIGVEVVYDNLDYVFSLEKWLATNGSKLDYIFVSRPEVANEFIDRLRRNTNAKILFSGVDIHYQRYARQVATTNELAAKNAMIAHEIIEKAVWSKSDVVYYFSEEERDLVISLCPGKPARAIPLLFYKNSQLNEVRARILKQGIATTNQLLFVGGFRHQPNVDAMLWFSRDVWPRILANIPDAKLCIAGSFPPPEVQALAGKSTIVTGYITDEVLRLLYSVSSVSIVPLRYGAGVKGKVFEALSQGMPLVTTSTGVQGINGAAKFAEICDTADAFSSAVIEILHNPKSRVEKILAGLDFLDAAASEKAAQEILALDVPEIS